MKNCKHIEGNYTNLQVDIFNTGTLFEISRKYHTCVIIYELRAKSQLKIGVKITIFTVYHHFCREKINKKIDLCGDLDIRLKS